jgi:hypothetical protein
MRGKKENRVKHIKKDKGRRKKKCVKREETVRRGYC